MFRWLSGGITAHDDAIVGTTAIQWPDGRIEDGRVEPPHVYVETNNDTPGTREQAREPAAVLVETPRR